MGSLPILPILPIFKVLKLAYIGLFAILGRGGRGGEVAEAFEEVFCSLDAHSRRHFGFGLGWTCGRTRTNAEADVKQIRTKSEVVGCCVDQWKVLAQLSPEKNRPNRKECG